MLQLHVAFKNANEQIRSLMEILGKDVERAGGLIYSKLVFFLNNDGDLTYKVVGLLPIQDENGVYQDSYDNFAGFTIELNEEGETGNLFFRGLNGELTLFLTDDLLAPGLCDDKFALNIVKQLNVN